MGIWWRQWLRVRGGAFIVRGSTSYSFTHPAEIGTLAALDGTAPPLSVSATRNDEGPGC
jgi:hypothetical protein